MAEPTTPSANPIIASPLRSFQIAGIIKQQSQLDAAVAELRKLGFRRIRRIKVRGGVVRREQHQRIKKCQKAVQVVGIQGGTCIARIQCFPTVAEDHIIQRDAASIVSVRPRSTSVGPSIFGKIWLPTRSAYVLKSLPSPLSASPSLRTRPKGCRECCLH